MGKNCGISVGRSFSIGVRRYHGSLVGVASLGWGMALSGAGSEVAVAVESL